MPFEVTLPLFVFEIKMEETTPKIKFVFKGRREDEIAPTEDDNNFQEESPSNLKIKIKTRAIHESEDVNNRKRKESFEEHSDDKRAKTSEENDAEGQDKIAPLRKILGTILNNIIKQVQLTKNAHILQERQISTIQ